MALEMASDAFNYLVSYYTESILDGSAIYWFKGTMPANADAYTVNTDYTADLLATFAIGDTTFNSSSSTLQTTMTNCNDVTASGTGTVTWFAAENGTHRIIGTVSTQTAGTGDMFVLDDNVVSGSSVSISSFEFGGNGV
jgi:hypothetical protein